MPMKSIRTKLLILTLSCVMISTAVAVSISILNSSKRLRQDAFTTLELMSTEKKNAMDEMLRDVEQGVTALYEYAMKFMPEGDDVWHNEEIVNQYIDLVSDMSLIIAENTDGAVTVYYRLVPELVDDPTLGTFLLKDENGVFQSMEPTDISLYDKDDMEHVGWYYIPLEAGEPTWLPPYNNANLNISMISYIIPVYRDGVAIGIIGIDIDTELLYHNVDEVKLYDKGYAFLMNADGEIINHDGCPHGVIKKEVEGDMARLREKIYESESNDSVVLYKWNGEDKYLMSEKLINGMYFTVCVPKAEIEAPRKDVVKYSIVSMWIVLSVFLLLTIQLTRTLVKPLKQLTATAERMAQSDLDIEIKCKTKDEVGALANSIQRMANNLKSHISQINEMAYWDSLTGLKSNAAYNKMVDQIDKDIHLGKAEFSMYIMDMNNLKLMNDTYGHKKGDEMLIDAANLMKKVWPEDSIYRIGGDEFAVLLNNSVASQYEDHIKTFDKEIEKFNQANDKYDIELQIAIGLAVYNKGRDESFVDVFRRADNQMYEDKHKKKEK